MRPLTKEADETDSPDENMNAALSTSRGELTALHECRKRPVDNPHLDRDLILFQSSGPRKLHLLSKPDYFPKGLSRRSNMFSWKLKADLAQLLRLRFSSGPSISSQVFVKAPGFQGAVENKWE